MSCLTVLFSNVKTQKRPTPLNGQCHVEVLHSLGYNWLKNEPWSLTQMQQHYLQTKMRT